MKTLWELAEEIRKSDHPPSNCAALIQGWALDAWREAPPEIRPYLGIPTRPKEEPKESPVELSNGIRYGMVLMSYITSEERKSWAKASLVSLENTVMEGIQNPAMIVLTKGQESNELTGKFGLKMFDVRRAVQPTEIKSNDGAMAWAYNQLIKTFPDVTHIMMLADDWIYNSRWLIQLDALVKRRPGAKACWVYRSTFEKYHQTIRQEGSDVLVKSINGIGCMTVDEWKQWGMETNKCPRETGRDGVLSLDLFHPVQRPGDRWVTARSYILNIGIRGTCQTVDTPDFAVAFVGVG